MTRRRLALGIGVFLAAFAASAVAGGVYADGFDGLAFGWVGYLRRVMPRVRVNGDGVATGVVCLLLFTVGLHGFLRWLSAEVGRASGINPGATPQTSSTQAWVSTNRPRGSAARAVSGPISGSPTGPSGHSARRPTRRSSGG